MRFSDEVLVAYVDGELDAPTRLAVEAAMADDAALARRIAAERALRERLRAAFAPVLDEPVPAHLVQRVRGAPEARRTSVVVPLRRGGVRPQWWRQGLALVASLVAGVLLGHWVLRDGGLAPVVTRGGRMVARGPLAEALTGQLTANPPAGAPVRIGISFRSNSGHYCRTFAVRAAHLAGLACRAGGQWQVQVLTRAEGRTAAPGHYREAASSMPAAVVAAVSAEIKGSPLDARAEAAAREHDWER
jgi:anti-sigma factor RsiW